MNRYGFALLGSLSAILSARMYVALGGSLNYYFLGYQLHHFWYGLSLLIVVGILKRIKASESLISFTTGMALGFIADEFDRFLSIGMSLDKENFNHMEIPNRNLRDMMEIIQTEDFLSSNNMDSYHKGILKKVRQEKENARNEMNSFMAHNPRWLIPKIVDNIALSIRHFQKADVDMSGLKWFNSVGQNQVLNPLNEALGLLSHLQDQVENKRNRMK